MKPKGENKDTEHGISPPTFPKRDNETRDWEEQNSYKPLNFNQDYGTSPRNPQLSTKTRSHVKLSCVIEPFHKTSTCFSFLVAHSLACSEALTHSCPCLAI